MFWEYRLYDSSGPDKTLLFSYDPLSPQLIVCKEENGFRKFTMFENIEEFYKYQSKIPVNERCFFETIMGNTWRKPYFDIDINLDEDNDIPREDADDMIEELTYNIDNELSNYEKKIIVTTSHTEKKHSYHIIVDGVKLKNPDESRSFARTVMTPKLRKYADTSVYKPTQQFRILGSKKENKDNKKVIDYGLSKNFKIPPDVNKEMFSLRCCMVTYTKFCREYATLKEILNARNVEMDDYIEEAIDMLNTAYPRTFDVRRVKELDGVNYVELSSNNSYYCKIHKRVHDNENAFVKIKTHMTYRKVYFDCRRIEEHEKKRLRALYLGSIPIKNKKIDIDFNVNSQSKLKKSKTKSLLSYEDFKLFN